MHPAGHIALFIEIILNCIKVEHLQFYIGRRASFTIFDTECHQFVFVGTRVRGSQRTLIMFVGVVALRCGVDNGVPQLPST